MKENRIVIQNEAPKLERFFTFIIDLAMSFIFICIFLFSIIAYSFSTDTYLPEFITNTNYLKILPFLLYFTYCFLFESLTNGRSIGKYITGTRVVMLDGSKPSTGVLFRRNLYRLIPLDVFSFLFGKGFHDSISKTRVVIKKDFEQGVLKNKST